MGEAQLKRSATARLMACFAQADAVHRQKTPVKAKGVTLREALFDDNFRAHLRKA